MGRWDDRTTGLDCLIRPIQANSHRRGQALIIALLVSFVLITLGAIFIGIIARNVINVQQSRERLDAQYFAEAGIRYATEQLTYSEDGADWRPQPDNLTAQNDPDYRWLKPYDPQDPLYTGYTRVLFGKGRALIRLAYEETARPAGSNLPVQRYIKIVSIGRVGTVDPNDPTTLSASDTTQRRELVAYVQVGSTDYAMFVMNKEQRATPMDLGAQDIGIGVTPRTVIGHDPQRGDSSLPFGLGPIRVNGNLRWSGNVDILLNPAANERVEVAGEIIHNNEDSQRPTSVELHLPGNNTQSVYASDDPSNPFITQGGLYRDGKPTTAADGYPRSIAFLEPPRMDTVDPATSQMRYRALTRESGIWRQRPNGSWYNTGQFGYGRGVYINNPQDIQQESRSLVGGYSLRGDWIKPGGSKYWNGSFYEPPGAIIELGETRNSNGTIAAQGFRITRNQSRANDVWYDISTGLPTWQLPGGGVLNVKSLAFLFREPNNPANPALSNEMIFSRTQDYDVPFNGVIFAEGNVRVRGVIPSNRQITIVTNGTAYIEGNLIKGNERSALAIIAKDYVCVNTTQFLRRTPDSPSTVDSVPGNRQAPFYFTALPGSPMRLQFSFGEDPTSYTGNFGSFRLFVRHASGGAGSFINLLVNPSLRLFEDEGNSGADPRYPFNLLGYPPYLYVLGRSTFQAFPNFERISFPLVPGPTGFRYRVDARPGFENLLQLQLQASFDPRDGFIPPTDNMPYYLSTAAVVPLDIKIQAALFAQDGSFFVIPGYSFNTDPADTRAAFATTGARPVNVASPDFPFYGEPLDIKLTIQGSICQNFTASINDQTEWKRRWGWIPVQYGAANQTIPDQHQYYHHDPGSQYAVNLFIYYDPVLRNPLVGTTPLRVADFIDPSGGAHPGKLLPALPRLPVCPKPIYIGELRP